MLCVVILLPGVFFPISSDIAIFVRGGDALLNGGKLYVDFIDLKPPLIYEIYAFINLLTGGDEVYLRIFDFFYQLLTIVLIVKLCAKCFESQFASFFAGAVYAVSYITLGFAQTLQGESFTCLWVVVLLDLMLSEKRNWWRLIAIGGIAGLFFSLKFTLAVVIAGVFIYELLLPDRKKIIKKFLLIILGFVLIILITFIPIYNSLSFDGFSKIIKYLSFYSAMPPIDVAFIKMAYEKTGSFFADNYSLLFVASVSIGSILGIKQQSSSRASRLIRLSILFAACLFISVTVEKKFGEYHFSRMLAPLSIIAGYGFLMIFQNVLRNFKVRTIPDKTIIVLLFLASLVFSPLPRWVNLLQAPLAKIKGEEHYDRLFEKERAYDFMRLQHKQVAGIINKNNTSDEKVLVISTGANAINFFLHTKILSKFAQSQFYFGAYEMKPWKLEFYDEIRNAGWLVVQNNDRHLYINGHNLSSYESLLKDGFTSTYLKNNYYCFFKTKNYLIFRRIEIGTQ